jgi:LPS export ABC transporter protein LptC
MLPRQRRMEVSGDVVFINAKGERLETEQLTWYQDSASISTDKPVRVKRGNDVVHGLGLRATEDFSRYVVRKVTGVLQIGDDTLAAPSSAGL